jgi:hypothetical protein
VLLRFNVSENSISNHNHNLTTKNGEFQHAVAHEQETKAQTANKVIESTRALKRKKNSFKDQPRFSLLL